MDTNQKKKEQYFDLEFLLRGKSEWYPGTTLATDEQSAISNFLIDYSPSMGTIVAVHVFGDDDESRETANTLARRQVQQSRDCGKRKEPMSDSQAVEVQNAERIQETPGKFNPNGPGAFGFNQCRTCHTKVDFWGLDMDNRNHFENPNRCAGFAQAETTSSQEAKAVNISEADAEEAIYKAKREAKLRREEELRKKHNSHNYDELLLHRQELSLHELKTLITFADEFRLGVAVQENLGGSFYADSSGSNQRKGLMISISTSGWKF